MWWLVVMALLPCCCSLQAATKGTTSIEANVTSVSISAAGTSLPAALYQSVIYLYSFVKPEATISYDATGLSGGKAVIKAGGVDFAGSYSLLKAKEYAKHPGLQCFLSFWLGSSLFSTLKT